MINVGEKLHFASDYMEGAHPSVMRALQETNLVSTPGYGEDAYCRDAKKMILDACECPEGEVYFLIGGTQTNAVVIDSMLEMYQGVIAAESGHIAVHEAGAIEFTGHKVLTLPPKDGKISADQIRKLLDDFYFDDNHEHMVMPGMVYISQPTEYGTIYSRSEMEAISEVCRAFRIPLFVDGARLAYALASPANDITLPVLAQLADVFYIGGTKCGLLFGEAVVLPKKNTIPHFITLIKQHGAMLAKGRLLGVQYGALFEDGLYERIGIPAIENAERIKKELIACGFELANEAPTNQIFFIADNAWIRKLSERAEYSFMERVDENRSMIRFATAWSTTAEKTDELLKLIREMSV